MGKKRLSGRTFKNATSDLPKPPIIFGDENLPGPSFHGKSLSSGVHRKRVDIKSKALKSRKDKGTKANSLTELKEILAQKKISLTLQDNVQGGGTSSDTPSLPDAEVTTFSPEDISIPQFPSQSNGILLEDVISGRVPHSQEEFFNFSFCDVPSLSPERTSSPKQDSAKQGKSCDASLIQVPSSSRNVLASQVSPNRDDFQRSVLLALREINEKLEVLAANQARLSLHLLPSDKIITRPSGIPPLPVHTEVDLRKVEAFLMESDETVSDLLCSP
ncbi:uncharacterized protein LOC124172506 [Ischnura elegans]|uniref:uncharacterized protein LOC124172506 n=1 Tax=Ischnura elegans TaxID=197161 RepID=UPI001ED89720|nr:uncharacterized protein LOC124172506 [Ischnura elegans]